LSKIKLLHPQTHPISYGYDKGMFIRSFKENIPIFFFILLLILILRDGKSKWEKLRIIKIVKFNCIRDKLL